MYSGILPEYFRSITYRTVMNKPLEEVLANFRGSEYQKDTKTEIDAMRLRMGDDLFNKMFQDYADNYKPRMGLWGSFREFIIEKNGDFNITASEEELYPWEKFEKINQIKDYDDGIYCLDYNLPEDAKVLIFDICENEYSEILKKFDYDVQKLVKEYDALIEISGGGAFDVPSICINNKETLKKLEIVNYFHKDVFDSEKTYFIKNGEPTNEVELNLEKYIANLTPEQKKDPEEAKKVLEEFSKYQYSDFFNFEKDYKNCPEKVFETLEALNFNELSLKEGFLEKDNSNKRQFGGA